MRAAPAREETCKRNKPTLLLTLVLGLSGCTVPIPGSWVAEDAARVYYCDGAGGGSQIVNWGPGVREGLQQPGVRVEFTNFQWQTGLGATVDQAASVEYKQAKGRKLADAICRARAENPDRPIHLVGFSAGSVVVLYALEGLPEDCRVDTVVLLASSVSADYDLTPALRHVRDHMHVFTSPNDAVLKFLVPITGTADRAAGCKAIAGMSGFGEPEHADGKIRRQYRKIVTIKWKPKFAKLGNHGGHTDFVQPRFVQAVVAPLLPFRRSTLLARADTSQ